MFMAGMKWSVGVQVNVEMLQLEMFVGQESKFLFKVTIKGRTLRLGGKDLSKEVVGLHLCWIS